MYIYIHVYLLPFVGSGKYFTNPFYFLEMERTEIIFNTSKWKKKFKYRNWKIHLFPQSGKNGETFFISLLISLHISLHFHKVENTSSLLFISMKCKKS